MGDWDFDVENITGADARKLVTIEKDGMVWVGIRAFHHVDKKWLNNGAESGERIVAWRDLPNPADPRFSSVPKEAVEEFGRAMREDVIPQIEKDIEERVKRATEARNRIVFR